MSLTLSQTIISNLWWGPLRRPFEAFARRTVGRRSRVCFGPMKGAYFRGGLAQLLGIYELNVQAAILHHLNAGDVFYDIGANNGYLTLLATSRVGSEGYIYAFEPYPKNLDNILEVLAKNCISNCMVFPEAISNMTGTVELYLEAETSIATPSIIPGQRHQSLQVSSSTLDEFMHDERHRQPNLIKLDVEGAEALVLEGAPQLLSSDLAPIWLIEIHNKESERLVQQSLSAFRYQTKVLRQQGRNWQFPYHLVARKVALK